MDEAKEHVQGREHVQWHLKEQDEIFLFSSTGEDETKLHFLSYAEEKNNKEPLWKAKEAFIKSFNSLIDLSPKEKE